MGYKYLICNSEEEAKQKAKTCIDKGNWPCYFFDSDKYIIDIWWDHNKNLYETKTPFIS